MIRLSNLLTEATNDKYVSIGFGRYKEKGKEKDSNAPTFKKQGDKFVPTSSDKGKSTKSTKGSETPKVNIFDKPTKDSSTSTRKWVNYDKDHSIDTNSGMIVPKGKESDTPNPKDIKGIDSIGGGTKPSSNSTRKWVNYDKDHSIDTNSGMIVPKGKESDNPDAKDIKGIDSISEPSPKKLRQGNPQVNKTTKSKAEELGVTPQKLGNKEYPLRMLQAAYEALTDSNYHTEARELIAKIEGKPEMAEKPDYPSMRDPQYKEKMAAISQKYASKYSDDVDDNARELGILASQEAGWDGVQAADAIAFTLRMNGFHKQADMIQSIFDNKPYMKNEGRISLSKLVNESEAEEIANLTGLRTQAVKKFIDDNNIDDRKLLAYLKIKGPKTLSNRMDISTAIVGKPNNKFAQGIIKAFKK